MGKLPSIVTEARRSLSHSFEGPFKIFAMFPIMNVAAKGMFKFIYTISSSVGSNIYKFTVGSGVSEMEKFVQYFDSKMSNNQNLKLFEPSLITTNR